MATVDNRNITTNMEEIFLLQSMDSGGGSGGGGFNGDYLLIKATPNQYYGIPSIAMGDGTDESITYASGKSAIAVGTDTVSANDYTYSFGQNNINLNPYSVTVGQNNKIDSLPQSSSIFVLGNNNTIKKNFYTSNNQKITIDAYHVGYLINNVFYKSKDTIQSNIIPFVANNYYYDAETKTEYFQYDNELKSLSTLISQGWTISGGRSNGVGIIGINNTVIGGKTDNNYCNYIFGEYNQISSPEYGGYDNLIFGGFNKLSGDKGTFRYNVLLGNKNIIRFDQNIGQSTTNILIGLANFFGNNGSSETVNEYPNVLIGSENKIRDESDDGVEDTDVNNNYLFGRSNEISFQGPSAKDNFLFGNDNNIFEAGGEGNFILGQSNQIGQTGRTAGRSSYNFIEGNQNKVLGSQCNHLEGQNNQIADNGQFHHIEGQNNIGSGHWSNGAHIEGIGNDISSQGGSIYIHVGGHYANIDNSYLEAIGNGTYDSATEITTKSNARTLDFDGNETLAGKLTVGAAPVNNMDVTTKQYVDNSALNLESIVAAQYNATTSYTANQDYVIYGNKLQLCNTNIAAGGETWNASHWTEVKVVDRLESIEGNVSTLQSEVETSTTGLIDKTTALETAVGDNNGGLIHDVNDLGNRVTTLEQAPLPTVSLSQTNTTITGLSPGDTDITLLPFGYVDNSIVDIYVERLHYCNVLDFTINQGVASFSVSPIVTGNELVQVSITNVSIS